MHASAQKSRSKNARPRLKSASSKTVRPAVRQKGQIGGRNCKNRGEKSLPENQECSLKKNHSHPIGEEKVERWWFWMQLIFRAKNKEHPWNHQSIKWPCCRKFSSWFREIWFRNLRMISELTVSRMCSVRQVMFWLWSSKADACPGPERHLWYASESFL